MSHEATSTTRSLENHIFEVAIPVLHEVLFVGVLTSKIRLYEEFQWTLNYGESLDIHRSFSSETQPRHGQGRGRAQKWPKFKMDIFNYTHNSFSLNFSSSFSHFFMFLFFSFCYVFFSFCFVFFVLFHLFFISFSFFFCSFLLFCFSIFSLLCIWCFFFVFWFFWFYLNSCFFFPFFCFFFWIFYFQIFVVFFCVFCVFPFDFCFKCLDFLIFFTSSAGPPHALDPQTPGPPPLRAFISHSCFPYSLFFSLWGSSRGILVVFLPGFHTTDRKPKRARLEGPSLQKHHQKTMRRPPERERKIENGKQEREKSAKCWATLRAPALRAPTLRGRALGALTFGALTFSKSEPHHSGPRRAPLLWTHPSGGSLLGLHFFWVWAPTLRCWFLLFFVHFWFSGSSIFWFSEIFTVLV